MEVRFDASPAPMNEQEIKAKLEHAAKVTLKRVKKDECFDAMLPPELKVRFAGWKFGKYGWTSPTNLLVTAAWKKWLNPHQDVCKIWANDSDGKPIKGAYSIRSDDEKFTVWLVSKFTIYKNFCSKNSGMQGSRAIEKMRGLSRINRGQRFEQSTRFDSNLFCDILNDINDHPDKAKEILLYLLQVAFRKKVERERKLKKLGSFTTVDSRCVDLILESVKEIPDPQFIVVVTAMLLERFAQANPKLTGSEVQGYQSNKSGANSQSGDCGDIWIVKDGTTCIASEVKNESKQFGFSNLADVEDRIQKYSNLTHYFLVTANDSPWSPTALSDPDFNERIRSYQREYKLQILGLGTRDLLFLVNLIAPIDDDSIGRLESILKNTPDLKQDTIQRWIDIREKYQCNARLTPKAKLE